MRVLRFADRALARYSFLFLAVVSVPCGVAGCARPTPVKPYAGSAPPTEKIYVISGGWHTELGLSLEALRTLLHGSVVRRRGLDGISEARS